MLKQEPTPKIEKASESRPDPLALAYQIEVAPWRKNLSQRVYRSYIGFWDFIATHWLFLLNAVNLLCLAAAFVVPLMYLAGWDGPANVIFGLFHYVCVQNPHHSFYIGGKQMCLCQRCMAIYGTMLLAGLVFYLLRHRVKLPALKTWQFIVFFCSPIALDGFTQLFGWRESTWELRFLTGGIFAIGAVWTLYPLLETKMARLQKWANREAALATNLQA
ncbi:MAG TPA: DUF2085 domain-containing protein [Chloroflexia bacterium]|nr:DUF2085 domain-containing protein [Chloroflexia bacterium]